ncbi:MAG: hypothetical protein AB8B87_17110 [Granulosicoccus sp.]
MKFQLSMALELLNTVDEQHYSASVRCAHSCLPTEQKLSLAGIGSHISYEKLSTQGKETKKLQWILAMSSAK